MSGPNDKSPDPEHTKALYNEVHWKLLDAAADEMFDELMKLLDRIQRERKINVRASMAIMRAITAKMYLSLDPAERDMAQALSQKMIGRLHIMGVRTPGAPQ